MAVGQPGKVRKAMASPSENAPAPMSRGRGFLHEVFVELKKTTWPTWPEAWRLTTVVVGVILVIAFYMALIDTTLSWLTSRFQLIK